MGVRRTRRSNRDGDEPLPDPLAYFLTWTTYGSWLPGDERGWVLPGKGFQRPSPQLAQWCRDQLAESIISLSPEQREVVEKTIREHCRIRNWHLHAVNPRSNHVHAIVTGKCKPKIIREQLKAWCTRKLNEWNAKRGIPKRENWWTEKGSIRRITSEASLEAAILYVLFGQ